jgi:hypothetical protein
VSIKEEEFRVSRKRGIGVDSKANAGSEDGGSTKGAGSGGHRHKVQRRTGGTRQTRGERAVTRRLVMVAQARYRYREAVGRWECRKGVGQAKPKAISGWMRNMHTGKSERGGWFARYRARADMGVQYTRNIKTVRLSLGRREEEDKERCIKRIKVPHQRLCSTKGRS